MPCLRRLGGHKEAVVELWPGSCIIGREPDCNVVIDKYESVSRRHCEFRLYDDGRVTVTDLGSANGTRVNDVQVFEETTLHHSDRVRLCREVELQFEDPEEVNRRLAEVLAGRAGSGAPAHPVPAPGPASGPASGPAPGAPAADRPPFADDTAIFRARSIENELERKGFGEVLDEIVKKTRKKRAPKDPPPERPNEYW